MNMFSCKCVGEGGTLASSPGLQRKGGGLVHSAGVLVPLVYTYIYTFTPVATDDEDVPSFSNIGYSSIHR